MTDVNFVEMARAALTCAATYKVTVTEGGHGRPYRLTVPPDMPGRENLEEHSFTFFDGADLRRVLASLGRDAQRSLELRAAALAAQHQSVKAQIEAQIEAQAAAMARLEAER